jgi:WH2 motif
MSKIQAVGLKDSTLAISKNFFDKIKQFDRKDTSNYHMNLSVLVAEFTKKMRKGGIGEFISFMEKHKFDYIGDDEKSKEIRAMYEDAFEYLAVHIVNEYSASDLNRFFPEEHFGIEVKPKLGQPSEFATYLVKLLGYWVRRLFNVQRSELDNANGDDALLVSKMKVVREGLKKEKGHYELHRSGLYGKNIKEIASALAKKSIKANVEQPENADANSTNSNSEGGQPQMVEQVPPQVSSVHVAPPSSSPTPPPSVINPAQTPPPPPPPSVINQAQTTLATTTPSNASRSAPNPPIKPKPVVSDRDNLLAQIRNGIKLKSTTEPTISQKVPTEIDETNLEAIISRAMNKRRVALEEEAEDAQNTSGDEWDGNSKKGVDTVDFVEPRYFVEFDNQGQIDVFMSNLEKKIPQNFSFERPRDAVDGIVEVDGVAEIIRKVKSAFTETNTQKTNSVSQFGQFIKSLIPKGKDKSEEPPRSSGSPSP